MDMSFKVGHWLLTVVTSNKNLNLPRQVDEDFLWFVTTTFDKWEIIKHPFMMQYRDVDKNIILKVGEYCKHLNLKFIIDTLEDQYMITLFDAMKLCEFLMINKLFSTGNLKDSFNV